MAAFPSCDAKFTTTALAKELKSWALFGPPLGRTWDATPEETRRLSDIKPLVPNDWALVHVNAPEPASAALAKAVDLAPFPKQDKSAEQGDQPKKSRPHVLPPAWHGTLLPAGDGDQWLAAAFADYEKIVALEKSLRKQAAGKPLDKDAQRKLALALFAPQSRWLAAARRRGGDLPLAEIHPQWETNEWYAIAEGKGVMLLAALRDQIGAEAFDKAMDAFGRARSGQQVTTAEFRDHLEKTAGHSLASLFDPWLSGNVDKHRSPDNLWSFDSFEAEPQRALIVYGTLGDREAQREAGELLQRRVARRGSNYGLPIKADDEVTDDELKSHHVLLVGRPATNSATARLARGLTIRFGPGSFVVGRDTYAHADSAVVAAGSNPLNDRYSVVVFAGLGARATRRCVENLPLRVEPAEIVVTPAGQPTKAMRLSPPSLKTAMP